MLLLVAWLLLGLPLGPGAGLHLEMPGISGAEPSPAGP